MAKSARGAIALATGTVVERGLRLVRNMFLARLLLPEEFGLVALVLGASTALEALAEVGVKQSVIHSKRGDETEYLNIAWWVQCTRGVALFLIAILAAPWIGSFYTKPDLVPLLRVAFVAILFNGSISPRVHVLEKRIQFRKWVFLFQGSGLLGTFASLGLAMFVVRSAWALVIGFVAEAAFRCLLSFVLCPFMPRLQFHRDSLIELLQYARRMLGVPILAVAAFEMDILVLGKVVLEDKLGMYWLARQLTVQLSMLFSKVIYPVLLPAFAEKQDDKLAIRRAALKVTGYTAALGVPVATFLFAYAKPVLAAVYGPEYASVSIPFGFLCVYAMLYTQGSTLSQIYFAIGKPNLHRRFVVLRLAILVVLLYPAALRFGLAGAAAVVLLANLVGLSMQIVWMRKPVGLTISDYASAWVPALGLTSVILLPAVLLTSLLNHTSLLNIAVGGVSCISACMVGLLLLSRKRANGFVSPEGIA